MGKTFLDNRGFSLLEVTIMVAILAIGTTVVLQTISFSARMAGVSADVCEAIFLAEDIIQDLEFKEKKSLIREESVSDRKEKFDYRYSIASTEPGMFKFNLDIHWQRLNRTAGLKLKGYLKNY
ncbi:MAG: prepilin-type N-terminal cleavage/methylation domain-containing protein [Candidatus Omnitrophica bacterium]|nr:prepilin-type N-terminal cleavage/methylation domain-containing protein [Candidatus Omnitrophota bacterium]